MHVKEISELLKNIVAKSPFSGNTFLVGGCVRDELLGLPIKDIDITVDLPNGGIDLAKYIGKKIGKVPVVYENFGTAMLNFKGMTYNGQTFDASDQVEFVQTRSETYHDKSRKPETVFGTKEDDALRRDFTINALYKDLVTGDIVDLTGQGLHDLEKGILRTTSDAKIIFGEDPLRIMRAIRFWLKYDLKLAPDLIKGLKANAHNIVNISAERIQDELNKILVLKNPDKAIELMREIGLLKYIIPELEELAGLKANPKFHKEDAYYHTLNVLKNMPPDPIYRLAGLFHDIGKAKAKQWLSEEGYFRFHGHDEAGKDIVKNILTRLKYPTSVIDSVSEVVANHMWSISEEPSRKATAKLLNKLKADVDLLVKVMEADRLLSHEDNSEEYIKKNKNVINKFKSHIEDISSSSPTGSTKTKPPISGEDVMEHFGIDKPGKLVGDLLKLALEYYYDNPNASKEDILKHLDSLT